MGLSVGLAEARLSRQHDADGIADLDEFRLAEHGGLFESAFGRPQNLFACESGVDLARLAASYAFGLAKNHAFVDGNKRIAFIAAASFLRLNGWRLVADQAQATLIMLSVASGAFSGEELATWIRQHLRSAE